MLELFDPVASYEAEYVASRPPEPVAVVTFRRVDQFEQGPARYCCHCSGCNLAVEWQAPRELVRRYEEPPRVPHRSECRSEDAYAIFVMLDISMGGAEKRAHNRQVDKIERHIEGNARHELARAGCPHAAIRRA